VTKTFDSRERRPESSGAGKIFIHDDVELSGRQIFAAILWLLFFLACIAAFVFGWMKEGPR
jgi:hypothetical protein